MQYVGVVMTDTEHSITSVSNEEDCWPFCAKVEQGTIPIIVIQYNLQQFL